MLVFHWALAAFLLLGAVQIFLAGLGAFRTEAVGADSAFAPHRALGFALGGVALVILVLALVARAGRAAVAGAAALVVLTRPRAEPAGWAGRRPRAVRRAARVRRAGHHRHRRLAVGQDPAARAVGAVVTSQAVAPGGAGSAGGAGVADGAKAARVRADRATAVAWLAVCAAACRPQC